MSISSIHQIYDELSEIRININSIDDRLVRLEKALGTLAQSIMEEEDDDRP